LTQRSRWRGNAGLDDSNPFGIFLDLILTAWFSSPSVLPVSRGRPLVRAGFYRLWVVFEKKWHFSGVFTFFHNERTLIRHGLTFFRDG